MANLKSTKKRARQNIKNKALNQARRTGIKTLTKKFFEAVSNKDISQAQALFVNAQSFIARARGKGILKSNTAAHRVSRLAKQLSLLTKAA